MLPAACHPRVQGRILKGNSKIRAHFKKCRGVLFSAIIIIFYGGVCASGVCYWDAGMHTCLRAYVDFVPTYYSQ